MTATAGPRARPGAAGRAGGLPARTGSVPARAGGRSGRAGDPLLEVRGLSVDYGIGPSAVHAVAGADLTLRRGEVVGLAGESGSGKSTLAYAVTRLLRPPGVIVGGSVRLDLDPGPTSNLLTAGASELQGLRWNHLA